MPTVITPANLEQYIEAIHATPPQVVLKFAGAGAEALAWLHRVGGSSRTILEATDHYAAGSMIEVIGFEPEHFASPQVARVLATQAFIRACRLAGPAQPVAGIGCTAAIATDRVKRGQHRCCIAVCQPQGVTAYALTFHKGLRSRAEEEQIVSLLLLRAVARVCGVEGVPLPDLAGDEQLTEQFEPVDLLSRLVAGEFNWLLASPAGQLTPGHTLPHVALLSGAFNPLHPGHLHLARVAGRMLEREIYFELPLLNADKGVIDLPEARRRMAQFTDLASLLLTRAPLFNQKARIFPHSVFIVGADTVARLVEPRFYNDDPAQMLASLQELRTAGCRFLVAGRLWQDRFFTLTDIALPPGYRELFEQIPETRFRLDISSSAIREHSGP